MQVTVSDYTWQHVGHLGAFTHQPLNTLMAQITQTNTDRVPWVSRLSSLAIRGTGLDVSADSDEVIAACDS